MNRHPHLIENSVVNSKKTPVTKTTNLSKYNLLKQGAVLGDHAQKGSELSMKVSREKESKVTTVVATPGHGPDCPQEVTDTDTKIIGNGSFGVVYQAKLIETNEIVAIKKVLQDKRFKNQR
jgi:hypothetical protein